MSPGCKSRGRQGRECRGRASTAPYRRKGDQEKPRVPVRKGFKPLPVAVNGGAQSPPHRTAGSVPEISRGEVDRPDYREGKSSVRGHQRGIESPVTVSIHVLSNGQGGEAPSKHKSHRPAEKVASPSILRSREERMFWWGWRDRFDKKGLPQDREPADLSGGSTAKRTVLRSRC